ncbi:DUF7562 family protein [Natronocalculus amylovorans]|uniref:Small CPxCG-related zinc finger protein n=1 Tax=Natronocalculus amylovorans TaxID=2917812 RepID=A0AAE3FV17_9EURY|nr:hypothetical protein [Natronocalculus amylovorans]MCL9815670.1 hypothetical protein [Natronocalculus amylovorans]
MWGSRGSRDKKTVVCIACGETVSRADAREYDKEGNRWERHGKEFEHLCKACFKQLSHQPRDELESMLTDIEIRGLTQEEFVERYFSRVEELYGSVKEPSSESESEK